MNLSLTDEEQKFLAQLTQDKKSPSDTQTIRDALKHYADCKVTDASQTMKLIVTKYSGHCIKCKDPKTGKPTEIPEGSWVLYGKGVGLICLDCYIARMGDKTIIAKYLKNRELAQITKALQGEADSLAQRVEAYRGVEKVNSLTDQQEKLNKIVLEYLTSKIGQPQEKEALENVLRENEVTKRLIHEIEEFIAKYLQNRKWRKELSKNVEYAQ